MLISLGSFIPVILMVCIVITNHLVTGQRTDKRTALESSRLSAALAAELRALLELYRTNLDLIAQKANYILSSRSSVAIYKGNLGRLTTLLDEAAIEQAVAVFAQNERIEAIIAAHATLRCNLTYQIAPADAKFDDWSQMYLEGSRSIAFACRVLESSAGAPQLTDDRLAWRSPFQEFFKAAQRPNERLAG
jgi:hypothetical protein